MGELMLSLTVSTDYTGPVQTRTKYYEQLLRYTRNINATWNVP